MALDSFAAAEIGPGRMRNRFCKPATFEGMAAGGLATDRLIEFHRAVAAAAIGMPTLAYLAVCEHGHAARGGVRRTRPSLRAARRALRRLPLNRAQVGPAGALEIARESPPFPICFARAGSASFSKRSLGCEATLRPIAARTKRSCTAGPRISIVTRTATAEAASSTQPVARAFLSAYHMPEQQGGARGRLASRKE
jgi:hypothetical protein